MVCEISSWCWFGEFMSWDFEGFEDLLSVSKHLEWYGC